MKVYIAAVKEAQAKDEIKPPPTRYIGECIWKIANKLSTTRNFIGYSFREDMIGDGIENCLRYLHNFNPEKSNPFAYFTQIIYFAFLRRIEKEQKQSYIKFKSMSNAIAMNTLVEMGVDDQQQFAAMVTMLDVDKYSNLAEKYEGKKKPAVKKTKAKKGETTDEQI